MLQNTNTASRLADLLALIDAYAEARHVQGHSSYNDHTKAARQAVKDALAAGQATAAPAQPAAQQGVAYAALPDLTSDSPLWEAIGRHRRAGFARDTTQAAMAVDAVVQDMLRAFADATHALRASHGQAPATAQAEEAVALDHIAVIEDGELRYMTGRKAPAYDCGLYAMPDGNRAPVLFTAPQAVAREPLDDARRMFDAGWNAAALFCDREDVVADRIIGFGACPQFEAAFSATHGIKGGQHGTE